jgi:hypothetical protein
MGDNRVKGDTKMDTDKVTYKTTKSDTLASISFSGIGPTWTKRSVDRTKTLAISAGNHIEFWMTEVNNDTGRGTNIAITLDREQWEHLKELIESVGGSL